MLEPVVISGIGLITPLGPDRETTWRNVLAGHTAGRRLTHGDLQPGRDDTAAAPWYGAPPLWPETCAAELRAGVDPVIVLARTVAREAVADARLTPDDLCRETTGCVFGTSKGGLHAAFDMLSGHSQRPFPETWASNAASAVVHEFGMTGPSLAPVAACATGLVAIIRAAELVRRGDCAVALAGSADYSLHPAVLASFQRLGVLSRDGVCRPFDRDRRGFVIGAGGGACVLERASSARQRHAPIYAAVSAGRLGADPAGMTALDVSGETLAGLIGPLVSGDGVPDLVHLHGTATRLNDPAECRAVRAVLGASFNATVCTSSKGALGHLLGAAGSVETALACLSLRDQCVPPSVHLHALDAECRLPFVTGSAIKRRLHSALKLSLGFGGHQAALRLDAW